MISTKLTWKVSVIGEPGAGKSSLISRMAYDSDSISASMRGLIRKRVSIQHDGENRTVEVLFQEINGFSGAESLLSSSNAVIIVVDITKPMDLNELGKFVHFVSNFGKSPLVFIAGSKLDRRYEAQIWESDFDPMKNNGNVKIYMVSSKMPDTVKTMLNDVSLNLLKRTMERR
ncbi:GTPase [mine drainage metagenome]|uniref:GTPase n=1 Tax=mine drainage metagenome TaxID=410659 RepID=T1CQ11_9ZZZZ